MAKVMISVPEALLEEIDRAAKAEHRSRSEFVREAAREYLTRPRRSPFDAARAREAARRMDELARANANPNWSGAEEIRRWRDQDVPSDQSDG